MNRKLSKNLIGTYIYVYTLLVFFSHLSAQCRRPVWADEFNKASAQVSRTNWSFGSGNSNDNLHYFTDRPENATVSNGTLKIIAREESYMGFDYTSALLFIKDKIGWRYGRIEASIKLPSTPGFVPAFWMMPSDDMYGWWPNSGEIDIMEYVTTQPYTIYGTAHSEYYNLLWGTEPCQTGTFNVPDAETVFHVYAIEWTDEKIDFFVDDIKYHTFSNQHSGITKWPFDQPFYVILNLAVGGGWCGPPTEETVFPAIMEVDYVRAYQDVEDISISGNGFVPYYSEDVVYSVPDIDDATYSWNVSGHGNILTDQNSHQIDVSWDCFGGEVVAEVESGFCTQLIEYPVFVTSNYLANSGFEKGVKYWIRRVSYLLTASMRLTTEEAHSGNASIDVNVQTLGDNPWDIQLSQTDLMIESGQLYEISFWAKADGNNRRMSATVINTETYFVYGGESFTLTTDWSQYAFQFTANASANVALNVDLGLTTGQFYLDDFVFTTPELSNQNQIENPDFTLGSDDWTLVSHGGSDATGSVENGEYAISIANGGTNPWDVHLGQEELLIENGMEYEVSFDAYGASSRTINTLVGKNTDPWTVYHGDQNFSLTTARQTYTYSFTMTHTTDNQARFGFDIGASLVNMFVDNIRVTGGAESWVKNPEIRNQPESFQLFQNYPNPFNSTTTIGYQVDVFGRVMLKMYDLNGREIATLVDAEKLAGNYEVMFDGSNLSSGMYIYKIFFYNSVMTRKLILLK